MGTSAQFAAVRSSSLSCYHPSLLIPTQSLSPNSKRPFAKMVSATPKQRKIAIVGSRSVGKSSLTVQFVDGHFVESYYPTIENTFSKVIKYKNQEYATEIVDTAGQDEYSILNSKHFIGIHGYVLVYSVASTQSFEMVQAKFQLSKARLWLRSSTVPTPKPVLVTMRMMARHSS